MSAGGLAVALLCLTCCPAAGFADQPVGGRPEGTLVLKSTYHGLVSADLSQLVVDEIRIVGSRCGPFPPALRLLLQGLVDVEPLIDAVHPLDEGLAAFEHAERRGALKILVQPQPAAS